MRLRRRDENIDERSESFVREVQDLLGPWLAGFGFSLREKEASGWVAHVLFTNGDRYVHFSANADPQDAPSHCNVAVGEGSLDALERDWNAVALWRLARDQGDSTASEYPYTPEAVVADIVARMREDVERYASTFLRGDVATFRRVRAETNRSREPYASYKPNGDGTYRKEIDNESAALKARFS